MINRTVRPAHRAHETISMLSRETTDFISPTLWLPNSPDLNTVNYEVRKVLRDHVYLNRIRDVIFNSTQFIDIMAAVKLD